MIDDSDNYIPRYKIPNFGDSTYTKHNYCPLPTIKPYPKVSRFKRMLGSAGKSKKTITLPSLKEGIY